MVRWWWLGCCLVLSGLVRADPWPPVDTVTLDASPTSWRVSRVYWSGRGRLELREKAEGGVRGVRATAERQGEGYSWLVIQPLREGNAQLRVVQVGPALRRVRLQEESDVGLDGSWWLTDQADPAPGFDALRTVLQGSLATSTLETQQPLLAGVRNDHWLVVDEPGLANYPQLNDTIRPWLLEGGHLVVTTRGREGLGAELLALLDQPTRQLAAPAGVQAAAYGTGWVIDWPSAATASAADWAHLYLSLPAGFLRRPADWGLKADALATALAPPPSLPQQPWGGILAAYLALALALHWRVRRWASGPRWLVRLVVWSVAAVLIGLWLVHRPAPNAPPTVIHRVVADSHETLARVDTAAIVRPSRAATVTYSGHSVRAQTEGPRGLYSDYGRTRTVALKPGADAQFTTRDTMLLPGTVDVELSARGTRLSGEVVNRLGSALRGAWLLTGDDGLRLGDIEPAATHTIKTGSVPAPVDRAQLFADLLGELAPADPAALAEVKVERPRDEAILLARLDPPLPGARLSGNLPAPAELSLIEVHAFSGLPGVAPSFDLTSSEVVGLPGLPLMCVERQYIPRRLPTNVRSVTFSSYFPDGNGFVWLAKEGRLEAFGNGPPRIVYDPATYTDGVLTTLYPIAAPSTAAPGDQP